MLQLEQQLLHHNLLNADHNNITFKVQSQSSSTITLYSNRTNTFISSSSGSTSSQPEIIEPGRKNLGCQMSYF
ncbi:unnamed protein product [Rotaria sp. Silwood2]|nr:unnamed protein product [Rotaria sp. Silwood2]